ncbi:OmpA family protein [Mycobacterium sp. M26]|uniref:channel-forming protein ArfA/OmpATb n=1 Tax=Mycobacterium sp. M26 TaxID=1762962 RepID=UPI00073E1870|nr:OmpA family protein [Mycobacterium sp. M26]
MTGSDDVRVSASATEWRRESRYFRRSPGLGWLLGLLLIPLLLGLIGWGTLNKAPTVNVSTPSVSITAPSLSVPSLNFAPLSILRNGNDFTLTGDLPDLSIKTSLLDSLKAALGSGVNLIDKLNIKAGVSVPDFSGLGALFKAAIDIPDFSFDLSGGTVTLTGTAPSEEVKVAVGAAATAAWPNVTVVNNIEVKAAGPSSSAPAPAPVTPSTGAPGAGCGSLQSDIAAALTGPINFETDGFTLTPATQQMLAAVAATIKACPQAKIAVTGYTDNTGNDAINIPLSGNRAKSVGDYLVSQGVSAGDVTTKGLGSADPIAGNDTAAGRAQNRRVEITVS